MKFTLLGVFSLLCLAVWPAQGQAETKEYSLVIARQGVTISGETLQKITVNGTIPGPVLHFSEGDEAVIHVTNHLKQDTSVHWHGMLLPGHEDGAPGFNGFAGIRPGETYTYRFAIRQSGTYWYHAHSMGEEQDGLYGGIVVAPKVADRVQADRDYVVVLSDFSREDSAEILAHLKMAPDYYQYHRRTVGDLLRDARRDGLGKAVKAAGAWGKMRMLPSDLSDVTGYDFLVNGMKNAGNWTGLFAPAERVRLRFVNAAAMTMFDVRIPGLKMMVVAADGQAVEPVEVDEFRIGNAETYDVIVTPAEDRAYTIAAEALDRQGFALGTLAPREGMRGEVPVQRPRAVLTMADMNMAQMMKDDPEMDMSAMDMASGWSDTGAPAGAKVLSYDDLRDLGVQGDTRAPGREITVRLGGNMTRYIWTINGKVFDPADGIHVAYNERVRITYVNETMMAHPVHLHGMYVQLDNGQPMDRMPDKHTLIVPPGQTVSVILTANEVGSWPLHCHLLYHMASGMMTTLIVDPPGDGPVETAPSDAHDMKGMTMPGMDMSGADHSKMGAGHGQ